MPNSKTVYVDSDRIPIFRIIVFQREDRGRLELTHVIGGWPTQVPQILFVERFANHS